MRHTLALLLLATACTFPEYKVLDNVQPACADGVCQEQESCSDGLRGLDEADVDCGGDTCARCLPGQRCRVDADCDQVLCRSGLCLPASCNDGILNQGETDVDCGHSDGCDPCPMGGTCSVDIDCDTQACSRGICVAPSCDDHFKNGDETALDCGGVCVACPPGAACTVAADCTSGVCSGRTCAAPSCDDDVENGGESDVDCGGGCSQGCPPLGSCASNSDCASQVCSDLRCVPSKSTGTELSTTGWVTSASATVPGASTAAAIDGNLATSWTSGKLQAAGDWYRIDMLESRIFFKLEIVCTSKPGDAVRVFRVLTSEDGTTFQAVTQAMSGSEDIVLAFDKPQVARYLEIEALAQGGVYWRIDDISIFE
jgi:hypothetical protein